MNLISSKEVVREMNLISSKERFFSFLDFIFLPTTVNRVRKSFLQFLRSPAQLVHDLCCSGTSLTLS